VIALNESIHLVENREEDVEYFLSEEIQDRFVWFE